MSKAKKEDSHKNNPTFEMLELCAEIKGLVAVRTTLAYGTGTGVRKTAESTISRAISAKVDLLSKMIIDDIEA